MNKKKIKIIDVLKNKKNLMTEEDGSFLYSRIKEEIGEGDTEVILDFSQIDTVTTAFINNSISKFVEEDGIDKVSSYLKIANLKDNFMKNLINISLEFAQDKYMSNQK